MKLLIVTDAWYPQVNGVVRTLGQIRDGLVKRGWEVAVLGPTGATIPCPSYKEIRLTLMPGFAAEVALERENPDCIHIATEGPLGRAARRLCLQRGWRFTTSFHTRFPEYLKAMFMVPRRVTYAYLRSFHEPSSSVLVPTRSIMNELESRGFRNLGLWGRGVDATLFHPSKRVAGHFGPKPVYIYVGRVAVEKNIEAFLQANVGDATKVVVGEGPAREGLQNRFPSAVFTGSLQGEDLARAYASADVFVFPSRTDTFGLVVLEALASGVPVAAYDVPGPRDILAGSKVGVLNEDLGLAARSALQIQRPDCREFALQYSWSRSIDQFENNLRPLGGARDFGSNLLTLRAT